MECRQPRPARSERRSQKPGGQSTRVPPPTKVRASRPSTIQRLTLNRFEGVVAASLRVSMLVMVISGMRLRMVTRETSTTPPQVEYALTTLGETLLEPVTVLAMWAQEHCGDVHRAREEFERARKQQDSRV